MLGAAGSQQAGTTQSSFGPTTQLKGRLLQEHPILRASPTLQHRQKISIYLNVFP
jgi:hypothetical protein